MIRASSAPRYPDHSCCHSSTVDSLHVTLTAPPLPVRPKRMSTPLRMLDLFAGAGGLTAGFHRADPDAFRVLRAVESDRAAAATYRSNFGDHVYAGRIEDWLRDEVVPTADLVIGGPPCQGFSTLGKQQADDARNQLWHSYAEVVHLAHPLYFVMENVPQFFSSPEYTLLEGHTRRNGLLADYEIEAHVLNAAQFGSFQIRKRMIIIGHRRNIPDPGFPAPTHPSPETWRTVRDAWVGLPEVVTTTRPPRRSFDCEGHDLAGPFTLRELHLNRQYQEISLRRFAAIPPGGNRTDLPDELKAPCWRRHTTGSMDVMGRLRWDRPSVTIRTEFTKPEKGRYLHPEEPRAITIAEGARLQGFGDDYRFAGSLTQITRQIGNAVPLELGAAIGRHILTQFAGGHKRGPGLKV